MSCPWFCSCSQCCCPKKSSTEKYPHILYKPPERVITRTPEFSTVPLEKIFGFQQPHTQYAVHPQISAADDHEVTTLQPAGVLPQPKRFFTHTSLAESPLPDDSSSDLSTCPPQYMKHTTTATKHYSLHRHPSFASHKFFASRSAPTTPEGLPILEQSDISPEEALTSATLCFSVYFDVQFSTLNIHLLNARNLNTILPARSPTKAEFSSLCVALHLEPSKEEVFQARLVANVPNPEFNERFTFTNLTVENVRKESIVFRIYQGSKPKRSNMIGLVKLQLSEVDLFGVITTVKIEASSQRRRSSGLQGRVLVSLMYDPISQVLQGTVVKANNLSKQNVLGLADPYLKVYLVHKGVRQAKWVTSVKRHTLSPVFNESFQFDVSQNYIQDLCLEFVMMEHERFSRNDPVGVFFIGEHTVMESGRLHWNETVSSPQAAISRWHSVLPTH